MAHIVRAIVHEIPKGRYSAEGEQVGLSAAETQLAPDTRRFVEDNMLDFALKKPRNVLEDTNSGSNTCDLVRRILEEPARNFVPLSQELAQILYRAQTGNSPSGILIIAILGSGASSKLAILKAEHQEGMRLQRVGNDTTGHFDLEHLHELIVGNNSRVYKIAVLQRSADVLVGEMVDQQNGVAFADFFMTTFLGCRLADNSEILTKQFVDGALAYVNKEIYDEVKQARYATALVAYMASPAGTFQAAEFADQFLDADDRDGFVQALPDDVSSAVIDKDLSLVPGQGSGLRIYGSGIMISASASALSSGAVEVVSETREQTTIRVKGALTKYGLGTGPKG
jgi:hypothetical protein